MSSDIGDSVRLVYSGEVGAVVTVLVTDPAGATTGPFTAPEDLDVPGDYPFTFLPATAGTWRAVFTATGTVSAAEPYWVTVRDTSRPSSVDLTQSVGLVRLLIPDLILTEFLFEDAQIEAFLGLNAGNVRRAAAEALETLASNEAMVSKVIRTQDLSTNGPQVAAELRARAQQLRAQADQDAGNDDGSGGFYIVDYPPGCTTELCDPEAWY